ncbi:tRNA pseudouridine(55) synthase TruB [Arachidicoccus ginsenosidimutans]|uniref:tRNA pseudouridine(55) synthase TruB n=1 Tax=Arachidicoccus sp. BS20 TaxID=1850526 RepID=UPI001E50FE1F|nr:tRNA pseudouridine(55) synthase TruB [Arachidicoccus sp. BS20]
MRQKPVHPAMQPFLDGKVILLNKPLRWTSFDAVKKIRGLTGVSKVGHAGTLDPLATGLLIVCTGAFTKKINEYMAQEKEYTGSFTLGSTTPTYDLESAPENEKDISHLTNDEIISCTDNFTGEIEQTPPIHSAIKKDGKPVYLAARKGIEVKLEPRKIFIKEFEITKIDLPKVYFRVVCSTGTYIRTLANDFGAKLNVGAHLSELCRTRIGNFKLEDAETIETFTQEIEALKGAVQQ